MKDVSHSDRDAIYCSVGYRIFKNIMFIFYFDSEYFYYMCSVIVLNFV